jgi:SNF2 family DNA or RNA helicase
MLASLLGGEGISYSQIDGKVPFKERSAILADFSNNPRVRVLLLSIETGAVGYYCPRGVRLLIRGLCLN